MTSRRIRRFVSAVFANPEATAAFRADPEAVFSRFELDDAERACFLAPTMDALACLGVHPLYRFRLLMVVKGASSGPSPMSYYLGRLEG